MTIAHASVPILGFVAASGTGKTTLLTALIPLLKDRGLCVGLIKHSHHNFQIDQPGKDSYRLREAGASPVMLVSAHRRAIITELNPEQQPSLGEELKYFDQSAIDLLLVEGFKAEAFPKIELHRAELEQPLLYQDDANIIAVASNTKLVIPEGLTLLDLNKPDSIASFIYDFQNLENMERNCLGLN